MKYVASLFLLCSTVVAQTITLPVTMPDPALTPGAVDPTMTTQKLCDPAFHTASVRYVPRSEKVAVCRAYGITTGCPGKGYELDHLVSLELGGLNTKENLWPQRADALGLIGYHTKDVVENKAHAAVCRGDITLDEAQKGIAKDWYQLGKSHGWVK